MDTKTILLSFVVVFLFAVFEGTEAASNFNITIPINRKLLGQPSKKCVVYTWTGVCQDQNCTDKIEYTLTKGIRSVIANTPAFRPYTDGVKQGVCFYDKDEAASCCNSLMAGPATKYPQQLLVSFKDYDKIDFEITRELYNGKISASDTFMLPWSDACQVSKPCSTYGTCVPTKPNEYNCTCNAGWEGRNCSDYTGWVTMYDKCLKDVTNVKKLAATSVDGCASQCKSLNVDGKIGCKSFEFIPASAGSKLGECRLFDVSNKHDKKELKTCSGGMYFDMIKLPDAKNPNSGGLVSVSLLAISINVAVAMLM